ncbi:MAG: vWA domain-containing protein, partial [Anaerorhabdus sp.]
MKIIKLLLTIVVLAGSVTFSNVSAEPATALATNLRPSEGDTYAEGVINQYAAETTTKNEYDVTVELTGKDKATVGTTTEVVFVLDTSGSMSTNERLEKMKEAVITLSEQLLVDSHVQVAIVTYASTVAAPLNFTNDISVVKDFVSGITEAEGNTFTQAGLKSAREILEASPSGNAKTLILISDGMPTNTYQITSTGAIENDEIRSYNGIVPPYKATGYDYNSIINTGSYPYANNAIYQVNGEWVFNQGTATISEILGLKDAGVDIYTVGVELSEWPSEYDVYNRVVDVVNPTNSTLYGVLTSSWTEEVKDRMIEPGEKVTLISEFKNSSGAVIPHVNFVNFGMFASADDLRKVLENNSDAIATYTLDGTVVATLTLDELIAESDINSTTITPTSCLNVEDGSVCKLEINLNFNEFTPELIDTLGTGRSSLFLFQFFLQTDILENTSSRNYYYWEYNKNTSPDSPFSYDPPLSFPELGAYNAIGEAEYLLKNIASDGVEGSTYFNISDVADLNSVLTEKIYDSIVNTVSSGSASITMGEYVTLVSGAYSGEDFKIEGFKDGVASSDVATGV